MKLTKGRNGGLIYRYEKGESGNPNGRPKGSTSKKPKLKKLISDLSCIMATLTDREKLLAYQLYDIAENDLKLNNVSSSINHLYFVESDFGIKIGISKNVSKRLEQIRCYAPNSKLIKIVKFGGNFENNIHKKFKHINIKNNNLIGIEWFDKSIDLIEFISEIDEVNDLHKFFNPKGNGQLILF
jgi:hypothetical protein